MTTARIRKLPPLVVNQIAAGEAIERPASVVKELIENSLDAGAGRIDVAVVEGGRQLIRVADDGSGIPADEMPLALTAHATSKLDDAEQLAAIATMGFRGEALASVASVSRLRLTSRATRDGAVADAGTVLEAGGDALSSPQPLGCAPGTVVEVRDLFFNTPARRKFLRTAPTEFGHIADVVGRLAMAHPHVGFTLSHNDRAVLDLPPSQSPRERCMAVIGPEMDDAVMEFASQPAPTAGGDGDAGPHSDRPPSTLRVWGLAGQPSVARATARFLYLFVNRRAVRDRNLMHAAREAYRGLMPPDRYPLAVVMIDIDPAQVDVNVHPAKAEVRFRDPSRIHGLVLTAIRRRLLESDLTPAAHAAAYTPSPHAAPSTNPILSSPDFFAPSFAPPPTPHTSPPPPVHTSDVAASQFIQFIRGHNPLHTVPSRLDLDDARQAMQHGRESPPSRPADVAGAADPAPARDDARPRKAVMQVHDSYLVTQDDDGIVIIDQHALHERVMFEQLRRRVFGQRNSDADAPTDAAAEDAGPRGLESQRLLMPEILDVPPAAMEQIEALRPLLDRIGIDAQPMGPTQLAVHAFPTFLFDRGVAVGPFMRDLLDKAAEGGIDLDGPDGRESALHDVLDMMACKAAVKAGDRLSDAELTALLAQREQVERASNCPHGRPTTLRLSLRDLARQFKRT